MTWIPLPPLPVAHSRLRITPGYHICPETGEVRNPRGRILAHRRAGGAGGLALHVWGEGSGLRRRKTTTTAGRLVALGMLKAGLVLPPPSSHWHRATVIDQARRVRWDNLAWLGRHGAAKLPLVLTEVGKALLGPQEPR